MLNMNTKFFALITFFFSVSAFASTPVSKAIPVDNVFSPRGYDTLDSSEIVIKGYLPNACHKSPNISHSVENKNIFVKVTSLFYHTSNEYCPEVIYPFIKTVDLGNLKKGDYKVFVNKETHLEKTSFFTVSDPILGEDKNQTYANVEYIERNRDMNKIILYGHNPSVCFVLDKVRVIDNGQNSISILPRMKKVSSFCPMKMTPFKITVDLDPSKNEENILIHVRSMYGNSINTIY